MTKWFKMIFLLLTAAALNLRADDGKFNLQTFIDTALHTNSTLQIAKNGISAAEQKIRESKSAFLPQISLSASFTHIGGMVSEFTIPFNGKNMTFQFMSPDNYSLKAQASEMVFNWGRSQNLVKMSQTGAALAADQVDLLRQTITYQIVPIYYNILFMQEALKVLDETRALFSQRLQTITARYNAGLASDFDQSLIEVQISSIDSQKLDLANNIAKMTLMYNQIASRDATAPLTIVDKLELQPQPVDLQQAVQEALVNRAELKQFVHQENLGALQLKVAQSANKPNLIAALGYEFRNGYMPDINTLQGAWTAVLSVNYPIFDGFRTSAQVAQAVIGLQTVQQQKKELERQINTEILQAASDMKTLLKKIELEKIKLGQAQRALKIAEERYEKGLMSTTDLIEAQTTLENSRLSILQLTVNYVLNQYNLYKATGRKIYRGEA